VDAANLLNENYLGRSRNGQAPIRYPHHFRAPVNTGGQRPDLTARRARGPATPGPRPFRLQWMLGCRAAPNGTSCGPSAVPLAPCPAPGDPRPGGRPLPGRDLAQAQPKSHWGPILRAGAALPHQPPHPAGVRRAGRPQRPAQF
jgi:hypothetical protein